jgi:tetratricopeptide (TPR) repeat protein
VASEIIFFGKEETKWIEKREVLLPVIIGQGIKEEPRVESFDFREDSIGPMQKMGPSTTQPGCAYSSRFTTGLAKAFVADKALYEQGRYRYLKGAYEDAMTSFQKLIQEYPKSEWTASSYYWMGEARYHQEKDGEAFPYFHRLVEKYPESEFYAYALYSCGWIRLKKDIHFSIKSMKKILPTPLLSPRSSGRGTASISLPDIPRRFRKWRFFSKSIRVGSGSQRPSI